MLIQLKNLPQKDSHLKEKEDNQTTEINMRL